MFWNKEIETIDRKDLEKLQLERLQKALAEPGQVVENALQTNGILLDDQWCSFLADEGNWLVGISLDGPEEIHDHYRFFHNRTGSFSQVMASIERLRSHGVLFNILTLLTDKNIHHPDELWNFFSRTDFSVKGSEVGKFYCAILDRWMKEGIPKVSVRLFEDLLIYHFHRRHVSCCFMGSCESYLVVEHNGDVYPCDFFVYPDWKLGSIISNEINDLIEAPRRKDFAAMKGELPEACRSCRLLQFCNGDCTKFRQGRDGGYSEMSAYCESLKMLVAHMEPHLGEIGAYVQGSAGGETGRNDPCPCGSGKKYKKCCGA